MKKLLIISIILFSMMTSVYAKEVLAPALQFDIKKYKKYFKKSTDYKANLKTRSDYIITCDADIIGVTFGDVENIKMFDIKNEYNENIDMKSVVLKTKYEAYSYIRLYKSTREIVNITLNTNPLFSSEEETSLGLCKIKPYRE